MWVDDVVVDWCLVDMVVVVVVGGGGGNGSDESVFSPGTVGTAVVVVEIVFWLVGRAWRIFEVLRPGEEEPDAGCVVVAAVVVLLSFSGAERKPLVDKSPDLTSSGSSEAANFLDDSFSEETGLPRD